jgi:chromate reductase, NAD(P)H dehydrogenase (quinone)
MEQPHTKRGAVRFLVFSASLRDASLNTRLADLAAMTLQANGGTVDRAWMREFDCPSYNLDVQLGEGFPAGAEELCRRLEACDAFVVSSPEYNASLPGVLKNAIDWVSRCTPQPFNERHGLLLSASPSMVGGNRGLWALRIPFEHEHYPVGRLGCAAFDRRRTSGLRCPNEPSAGSARIGPARRGHSGSR